jgi:hypothetical protein
VGNKRIITVFGFEFSYIHKDKSIKNYSKKDCFKYISSLDVNDNVSDTFVPITKSAPLKENNIKLIAFYLPQFYPIALNNDNFGQGFTEWFNVTKMIPQFVGHYQPHLPIDVGFYDLSHEDIMFRQIELAKLYGIFGFCAYYYWFAGEKLLNKPFENYLNNKNLDFPFCFCWALENWNRKWDSGNQELIIEQKFEVEYCQDFFDDFLPFVDDKRYIKISQKPVLLVYKTHLFDRQKVKAFFDKLRLLFKENRRTDINLFCVRTNDMFLNGTFDDDPASWGFDAYVDFPPHNLIHNKDLGVKKLSGFVQKDFRGRVFDMGTFIKKGLYKNIKSTYKLFQGCFPSWDDCARNAKSRAGVFDGLTTDLYKQWLAYLIDWTKRNHNKDEQIVFINAWNEWAEGAHLEPDRKNGYAYLQATKEALEESQKGSN